MRHLSKFLPLKCSLIQKVHLRSLFAFLGWHVEGVYVCVFVCVCMCVPRKEVSFFHKWKVVLSSSQLRPWSLSFWVCFSSYCGESADSSVNCYIWRITILTSQDWSENENTCLMSWIVSPMEDQSCNPKNFKICLKWRLGLLRDHQVKTGTLRMGLESIDL